MTQRRDYYRVLHVQPDAPDEIIKVSYRTLMQRLKMHPDLGGDHATASLINEAFRTLGHPDRRAAYDKWLESSADVNKDSGIHTAAAAAAKAQAAQSQQTAPPPPPPAPEPSLPQTRCYFCNTPHDAGLERDPESVCRSCGGSLYPVQRHERNDETRRAVERVPRNMLVVFARRPPHDQAGRGVTQDISLAGMRFTTSTMLGINDRLLLETEFCSAVAIVRSATQRPTGWEIGVQFFTMRVKRPRGGIFSTVA